MRSNLNISFINSLKRQIPIKEISLFHNEISLIVEPNKLKSTLQFLKNNVCCQYKVLSSISGTDFPQKFARFEISYDLLSLRFNNRIRVKTQ